MPSLMRRETNIRHDFETGIDTQNISVTDSAISYVCLDIHVKHVRFVQFKFIWKLYISHK